MIELLFLRGSCKNKKIMMKKNRHYDIEIKRLSSVLLYCSGSYNIMQCLPVNLTWYRNSFIYFKIFYKYWNSSKLLKNKEEEIRWYFNILLFLQMYIILIENNIWGGAHTKLTINIKININSIKYVGIVSGHMCSDPHLY